jgi:hypothetical protein
MKSQNIKYSITNCNGNPVLKDENFMLKDLLN